MNNIAETNKVLALLNLKLVTKGKDYLILDSNTDEITRLQLYKGWNSLLSSNN